MLLINTSVLVSLFATIASPLVCAAPPRFSEQFQTTETSYSTSADSATHYLTHFTNKTPRAGLVWNGKFYFGSCDVFEPLGSTSPASFATGIASWDGYSWYPLFDSVPCSSTDPVLNEGLVFRTSSTTPGQNLQSVMAMGTFNGFSDEGASEWLVVSGRISRAGRYGRNCGDGPDTVRNIAAWQPDASGTGGTWKVFGGPDLSDANGAGPGGYDDAVGVRCMFIGTVGGQKRIYIFGDFDKVEQPSGGGSPLTGLNGVAYYDGTSWNAVADGPMVSGSIPRRIHTVVPVKLRAYPSEITLIVGGWFDLLDQGSSTVSCNSAAIMRIDSTSGAVTWEPFDNGVRISDGSAGSLLAVVQRAATEADPYPLIYVGGRIDEVATTTSAVQVANIARVSQPSMGGRVWQRIDGTTANETSDSSYVRSGVVNRGALDLTCGRFIGDRSKATVSALAFGPADPASSGSNSKLYIGGHFTFAGVREKRVGDDVSDVGLIIDQDGDCDLVEENSSAMFMLNVCTFDEDEQQQQRIGRTDIGLHANNGDTEMSEFLVAPSQWSTGHANAVSCLTSFVSNWNGNTAFGPDQSPDAFGVYALGAINSLPQPRASREDMLTTEGWCFPINPGAIFSNIQIKGLAYWDCNQVQGREPGLSRVFASEWKEMNQGFAVVTALRKENFEADTTSGTQVSRERLVIASQASSTIQEGQALLFDGESLRRVDWPGHVELQADELPSPAHVTAPLRPGYVSGINDAFALRITATNARTYTTTLMTSTTQSTPNSPCFANSLTCGYVNSVSMTNVETRLNPSTPPSYSEMYSPRYWQQWGPGARPNANGLTSSALFNRGFADDIPHRVRAFERSDDYVADVYKLGGMSFWDGALSRARGLLRLQIPDISTLNVIADYTDPMDILDWESGFDDAVVDETVNQSSVPVPGQVWDMIPWPDMEGVFVIGGRFTYSVSVGEDSWTCVNIALYEPASGLVYPVGSSYLASTSYGVDGTVKVLSLVRDPFSLSEIYKIAVGGEFSTDQTAVPNRLRCIGFVVPSGAGALGPTPRAQVDPVVDCSGSYGVGWSDSRAPSVNAIVSFQHELQFADSTPALWIGGDFNIFFGASSSYPAQCLAAVGYSGFRAPQLGVGTLISNQPAFVNCMSVMTDLYHGTSGEQTRLYIGGDFGVTVTSSVTFGTPTSLKNRATANLAAIIPGEICGADYNGDGVLDFFDYLDFAAAFAIPCNADFNRDGVTDFFDYLDFVDEFAAGCDVEPMLK